MMTHMGKLACVAVVVLATVVSSVSADQTWKDGDGYKQLLRHEVKVLQGLLRGALKADYRRQAWYLADRILASQPDHEEATQVLERWEPAELLQGQEPKAKWIKKRDKTLRNLGDAYFHFGETLEAAGVDPVEYYPINERAHAYGSQAGNLLTALRQSGYVWVGTYTTQTEEMVQKLLGDVSHEVTFPEEFDDGYLRMRVYWPDCKCVVWGDWRLVTDHKVEEALRLVRMLAKAEGWMRKHMGGKSKKRKRKDEPLTDLLVFSEVNKFDKIGADLVREEDREKFIKRSGWVDRWRNRVLVSWRRRDNPWTGDDDTMLGYAAQAMARKYLSGGAGGSVQGRGAWLLSGIRGAFEGFELDEDGKGTINPDACWRLGVARALRDEDALMDWSELFELTLDKAEAIERHDVKIEFAESQREAKNVDVVAAQATALVVGVLKADKGKGAKKLGKLVGDLFKRDSLPAVDKTLGWKKGRAVAEANRAMDAAN